MNRLNRMNWKRIVAQSAALAALTVCALALSGCAGTLYPQDSIKHLPGLNSPGYDVTSLWVVQFLIFALLLGPAISIVMTIALRPYIFPPFYKTRIDGLNLELWVSENKYPMMAMPDVLVVPVAPDLKMVFGAAKIARDAGAGQIQAEADKVAPLKPGDAFVGKGAKYKWHLTALAVIFDAQKRANPELMAASLRKALTEASAHGADSAMIPDMTENLLAQPNWISDAQKAETAQLAARLTLDAALACRGTVDTIKIWVYDKANADAYVAELEKLDDESVVDAEGHIVSPMAH